MNKKFQEWLEAKGLNIEEVSKDGEILVKNLNEYTQEAQDKINVSLEGKADASELIKLKEELVDRTLVELAAQKEAQAEQGVEMAKMKQSFEEGKTVAATTFKQQLKSELSNNLDSLKAAASSDGKIYKFDVKVAGDMTFANSIVGEIPQSQRLAGYNDSTSRLTVLQNIVSQGVATSNDISWVYKANEDGTVGGTVEAALKNLIDWQFLVDNEKIVKRTGRVRVTTEMLDDVEFMAASINKELMRELMKDVENQIYQGDGTPPNMNGIKTVATAFVAGSFAGTVDNANLVDLLRVAINQIRIAEQPSPTYILLHPSDLLALKLLKVSASDDRYIQALQEIAAFQSLDGVPIITTTLVTQDDYLVGAFDLATFWRKEDMSIQIGTNADDFSTNQRTVLIEMRGCVVVKNNDRGAFVEGVISTDIAVLETI